MVLASVLFVNRASRAGGGQARVEMPVSPPHRVRGRCVCSHGTKVHRGRQSIETKVHICPFLFSIVVHSSKNDQTASESMALSILLLSVALLVWGPTEMESVCDKVTFSSVHLVEASFQGYSKFFSSVPLTHLTSMGNLNFSMWSPVKILPS